MPITDELVARANRITVEQAETLRLLVEAEMLQERAAEYRAKAQKEAFLAKKEERYAEQARIGTARQQRDEKIALSQNHHHHEYWFNDGVDEETVLDCIAQLAVWHRQDPECPMHIIINSPGGSVIDGMHLFDQISAYSKRPWDTRDELPKGTHDTTITVRGYAASMGGILLQAADNRRMGPEAYLMVHQVSSLCHGKLTDIEDEVDFLKKITDRVIDIFLRRCEGKTTRTQFKRLWDRKDAWLSSTEALERGFVDEIG